MYGIPEFSEKKIIRKNQLSIVLHDTDNQGEDWQLVTVFSHIEVIGNKYKNSFCRVVGIKSCLDWV